LYPCVRCSCLSRFSGHSRPRDLHTFPTRRSSDLQTFAGKVGELIMPTGFDVYDDPRIHTVNGTALNGFYAFDDEAVRAKKAALVDRKSTRLNSSHVKISYAVFCLKKRR